MYIPSKPYVTSDPIPEDWFGLMISHKSRYKSMVEEELTGANEVRTFEQKEKLENQVRVVNINDEN